MGKPKIAVEHEELDFGFKPYQHMLELEGTDPDYEYRYARKDPAKLRYWKKLGFEVVTAEDGIVVGTMEEPVGGRYEVAGELVVMKRKRVLGDKHRAHLRKKAAEAARQPRETFKQKMERIAGPYRTDDQPMGIDTTKERRGPWSSKDDPAKDD